MTILKAILSSVLFILFIHLTVVWSFLNYFNNKSQFINDYKLIISSTLILTNVIILFILLKKTDSLIPKKTSFKYYVIAIILGFLFVLSQKWLNYIYDFFANTNLSPLTTYNFAIRKFTYNSFASIIILPIAEEFFFRNYIQKGLQEKYKPFISIIVSSILFALAHLPNIHFTFLVVFGGIISAILYHNSKSIIPSFIYHVVWNLTIYMS